LAQFVAGELARAVRRWRKALCLSNDDRDALKAILAAAGEATQWDELSKARRKRLLARPVWPAARALVAAVEPRGLIQRLTRDAAALYEEGLAPAPLLSGEDLIEAGLKPGPRFGELLEQAYDAQLAGDITDREQALAWLRRHA
jgi:hypothetical protein